MALVISIVKSRVTKLCTSTLVWIGVSLTTASVVAEDTPAITPPDVYQNVGTLLNEIEQIRQVMGVRPPRQRTFTLQGAVPRQVFYQAQTLYRKTNQLAQEMAGLSRQAPLPAPEREIVPADVFGLVSAAREQLGHVKAALGLTEEAEVPKLQRRREPSDVMHDIIEAGYILNGLISRTADTADVYDRVMQMIVYLGGALPEDMRYPELPEFECCLMPEQAYQRLVVGMETLRPVAEKVDITLVRIRSGKRAEGGASIETVYDLATVLLSDVAELTIRLDAEDVAGPDYPRPPRIFPSHVNQLAIVFHEQAKRLIDL